LNQYLTIDIREANSMRRNMVVVLACLGMVLAYYSRDSFLFFIGISIFLFFSYQLFNTLVPPVLLFSFFFEWLFNQGQLFKAFSLDKKVSQVEILGRTVDQVILLGFLATFFFFLGIVLVIRKAPVVSFVEIRLFFLRINLTRLLRLYIVIYFILVIAGAYVWFFPGLAQPLFMLTYFRWSVFFLLFCTVFFQNRFKLILVTLIMLDMALGFVSFFSSFKEVIYFSFIAYWMFFFRSRPSNRIFITLLIIPVIYLGSFWTYIKKDYRNFVNKGSEQQIVHVSRTDALSKISDLATTTTTENVKGGFDVLIDRLSLVRYFNAVYNYVPVKRSFEYGALWWEGITRPFLPRLFFPGKSSLLDSKELNYYSGLNIEEKNTSVSLSMVAGSYVDFGATWMFVPLFLFGLFCGWVWNRAIAWGKNPIVGYSLTMPMIYLLQINQQSINRIISAMVLYIAVLWFIQKVLLKPFMRYILAKN